MKSSSQIRRRVLRRMFALLIVFVMVFEYLPNISDAGNNNNENVYSHINYVENPFLLRAHAAALSIDVDGLTASYENGKWIASGTTVNGSATGTSGCNDTAETATLTLKNSKGTAAQLSFDYAKPVLATGGSVTIDGTSVTTAGSFTKLLGANEEITIVIVSGNVGEYTSSVVISNLNLVVDQSVTMTFKMPQGSGSYKVNGSTITTTTTVSQNSTTAYTLVATPASGNKLEGWYNETEGKFFSSNTTWTGYFESAAAVYPIFITSTTPVWEVGQEWFTDLSAAITYAQNNSISKIVLFQNGTLSAGNYTIPNGKTVLIPMDAIYTSYTTTPDVVYGSHSTPFHYRTLTMASGANITVQSGGAISVPSKLSATGTGSGSWNGTPTGAHGHINMTAGSNITLQSDSNLYCYGYISGSGQVTAESGSTVWECFQLRCWRGGSASSGMTSGVFPMSQYYVQNIEASLTLKAGATEKIYTSVNASSTAYPASATFIGTGGLFVLNSGSITKKYVPSTDRLEFTVDGNASLSPMTLNLNVIQLNTSNYQALPINSNITIHIVSGTTTVNQNLALLPGTQLTIDNGASVSIASGKNVYVYDQDEWGEYAAASQRLVVVGYSTVNGTTAKRTAADLVDSVIDLNGTINISGTLYTTQSGAAIISSEKTGTVVFSANAGTATTTQQATQSGTSITKVDIPITAAQLKNGDASFTETAGAKSNDKFYYCATHDKWEKGTPVVITFNANGGTGDDYTQNLCSTGGNLTLNTFTRSGYTFAGWNTKADGTGDSYGDGANVTFTTNTTLYAQWTEAATDHTVAFNANGGSGSMSNQTVPHNTATALNANSFTRTGYTFKNWNTKADGSGTTYANQASVTLTADLTLYAQWQTVNYSISYDLAGGTATGNNPTSYTVESNAITLSDPTKTGYTFAGWTGTGLSGATTPVTIPTGSTGNRSYTATWTAEQYTISYDLAGGTVNGTNPASYTIESNAITLINPTKTGYTFAGWTGTGLSEATETVTIPTGSTGNRSYTATWTAEQYTISYDLDGGSVNGTNPTSYTIESNAITLIKPTKTGYTFVGWTGTGLSEATMTVTIPTGSTGARTYTATWKLNQYTITWLMDDGSLIEETVVDHGTVPTHAAPVKSPTIEYTYSFAGWNPAPSAATGPATYTATFTQSAREYFNPVWTWDGYSSAVAVFTAKDDSLFTQTVSADSESISSEVTVPATCTENGTKTYTATVTFNGKDYTDSKTEEIPALGHDFGAWTETLAPTCTAAGEETRYCSRCDATETREVAALGHDWGEPSYVWDLDNDSNWYCTATRVCSHNSNHTESETASGEKITRSEQDDVATYTATFTNNVFAQSTKEVDIAYYLTGNMLSWGVDENYRFVLNSSAAGEYMLKETNLAVNDQIKVIRAESEGSKILTWYPDGVGNHYTVDYAHSGKVNVYFRPAGNHWNFHTGGYFYISKLHEVTIVPDDHDHGNATIDPEEPDYTMPVTLNASPSDGYHFSRVEFYKKTGENTLAFVEFDEIGWNANNSSFIMPDYDVVIKVFFDGHTVVTDAAVAPTCTETGLTEGSHCSVCGAIIVAQEEVDALGHDWSEWAVTSEPTNTEAGEKTRTCNRCGATETKSIFLVTFLHEDETPFCTDTVDEGSTVPKPQQPVKISIPDAYQFAGWYLDGVSTAYDFNTPVTGNLTLVATWKLKMKLSVTVTLKDNLDVNLYVRNISEDEASHYYIKWTFKTLENDDSEDLPGDAELQSVSQYSAETYKLVMASIFAYQMTRPFIINVYYDGTRIVEDFSYSVRDYLEAVINTESEYITEKDKDVSRKALDYGANAQLFFDGRTYYDKDGNQHTHFGDVEHLANENTNSTNEITATKPSNTVKKTGSVTGLSKMSVSLILGTEISIKIYFNYSGDMGQLSFYCDNKSLTEWVQEGENRYSVKVEGIRSYELYKDYTVTITDGTGTVALTYSPYAYAASNWNSTVEYLSNLVKALVAYGDAARNRWPN